MNQLIEVLWKCLLAVSWECSARTFTLWTLHLLGCFYETHPTDAVLDLHSALTSLFVLNKTKSFSSKAVHVSQLQWDSYLWNQGSMKSSPTAIMQLQLARVRNLFPSLRKEFHFATLTLIAYYNTVKIAKIFLTWNVFDIPYCISSADSKQEQGHAVMWQIIRC